MSHALVTLCGPFNSVANPVTISIYKFFFNRTILQLSLTGPDTAPGHRQRQGRIIIVGCACVFWLCHAAMQEARVETHCLFRILECSWLLPPRNLLAPNPLRRRLLYPSHSRNSRTVRSIHTMIWSPYLFHTPITRIYAVSVEERFSHGSSFASA